MAYNVSERYNEVIYSGDAKHRLKLLFNNVEYETANSKTESIKKISKIFSDGGERFSLDNFKSQTLELVIHDIDLEDIIEPISISIGTLVNGDYEYVPIGIFNLDEKPTTSSDKTTIKMSDNAIKFDFPYNAQEVIEANGGEATMMQILQDICEKAGVDLETTDFINKDTKVSVWDNSINARQYVMYIAEKAGCIATINRDGKLQLINLQRGDLIEDSINTSKTLENVLEIDKIKELQGNTTQNGTPTPSSPVPINNVTGLQKVNVCGKNLLDISDITTTSYITNNGDGSITLNGTGTGGISFSLSNSIVLKANTTYTLSLTNTNSSYSGATFILKNGNTNIFQINYGQSSVSYTPTGDTTIDTLRIYAPNTITFNNFTFSVQLEKGSTATSYEEYKGQSYEVNLGKNLFDKDNNITTGKTYYNDGSIGNLANGFIQTSYIDVDSSRYYTLSTIKDYHLSVSDFRLQIIEYDENKNFIKRNQGIITTATTSFSVELSSTTKYVRLGGNTDFINEMQLEKGSTATSYSEYFTPIELNKIGDYEDRIYKDNGKWYKYSAIGKIILDGTENWSSVDSSTRFATSKRSIPNIANALINTSGSSSNLTPALSNYFTVSIQNNITKTSNNFGFSKWGNSVWIYFSAFKDTVADFQTWLSNNKPEIDFVLATPTITEITNTDLINQLESIRLLKGTNNITITSEDLTPTIDLSYYEEKQPIELNPLLFEKYTEGDLLEISRVVYEDAIRKFEYGDESKGTLYINSANPYITDTTEIENIYNSIDGFNIYSLNISKMIGNPAIDPWDIIQFTYKNKTYRTLAQNILTYNGVITQSFDTQIGTNEKSQENVTINSEESRFRKIGTDINQLEGTITMIAGEVGQYNERITTVEQSVDRIEQSAISYEDLKRNVKASNLLHIENAVPNYPLRFSIKNASLVYPSNYLYPSDNLYPIDALHLVVDKTRDLSEDAKFIELPIKKLYSKDNVYDEFVVENKRAYIIHRIGVNQDESTYILENEVTEELGSIEIKLFEDDNYLYLYEFQNNEGVIYEIDYTIPSAFTDAFATEVYVDSSITQTANQIMLQVDEKVDEEEIIAKLNVAVEDGQGVINLVGNTVTIDSDNFKLDADGKIDATAGKIGGFEIDETTFSSILTTLIRIWNGEEYVDTELEIFNNEDLEKVRNYISGTGSLTPDELIRYDVNKDGIVDVSDLALMTITTYYNISLNNPGKFLLNTTSATNVLTLYDKDSNERVNLGIYDFLMQNADGTKQTQINFNGVSSPAFNNNSLESLKKDIVKYENALDVIKKSDVYSYHWKSENDYDKKHYGLVIGENYNTPDEFISNDGKGIDTYAMISICLEAIKEQQEEIEDLKKEIKLLKEGK